jgi:PAS domain S-box-containing protein
LHSFEREFTPFDTFAANFRKDLSEKSPRPIDFIEVSLQPARLGGSLQEKPIADYLFSVFGEYHLDLVVTIGGPAAVFAQKYRQKLFRGTPLLLAAVDQRFLETGAFTAKDAAIAVRIDGTLIVENITRILPQTTTVFVVIGTSEFEQYWRDELERQFQRFNGRLRFVWSNEFSFDDTLTLAAALPPHSAIFYVLLSLDANDVPITEERALGELHAVANAPIFGFHSTQVGRGVVGGPVMDIEALSGHATTAALRILRGESPDTIKTATQVPGPAIFDGRELRRWSIAEDRLPPGSRVEFREPTTWERYKWPIVGSASLVLAEALLILALLTNQIKRRRAERSLRESEERFRLLTDAAPMMVWMADSNNKCIQANRAWYDFIGRLGPDLGLLWIESVHPDDMQLCRDTYLGAFNQHEPFQMEYRVRRYDGEYRWILVTGVPRFTVDGSFVGYIGSAIDVTEHMLAEAALSGLSRKLMEAHEEERTRIARELHDDIGQRLVGMTMQLHNFGQVLPNDAADLRIRVRDLCGQAIDLERDLQAISHQLHSSKLEHLGLAAAAEAFCRELSEQRTVRIDFTHHGVSEDLSKEIALSLFRVLQEALNNAVKHSGTQHFLVTLAGGRHAIQLEVTDYGVGFDPEAAMRSRGLGLISMKERLSLVDGEVVFESQLGVGTRVRARVPIRPVDGSPTQDVPKAAEQFATIGGVPSL